MPQADRLPDNLRALAQYQSLNIDAGQFYHDTSVLIKTLEAIVSVPEHVTRPQEDGSTMDDLKDIDSIVAQLDKIRIYIGQEGNKDFSSIATRTPDFENIRVVVECESNEGALTELVRKIASIRLPEGYDMKPYRDSKKLKVEIYKKT